MNLQGFFAVYRESPKRPLDMLYRMKKDTVRPRDRADADRLRRRLDLEGE